MACARVPWRAHKAHFHALYIHSRHGNPRGSWVRCAQPFRTRKPCRHTLGSLTLLLMYLLAARLGPSPLVAASSAQQAMRDLDDAAARFRELAPAATAPDPRRDPHAFFLPRQPSLDSALEVADRIVAAIAQGNASLGNRPKPVMVSVSIAAAPLVSHDDELLRLTQLALDLRVRVLVAAVQPTSRTSPLRALGHGRVGSATLPLHEVLAAAPAIERRQKELADGRFRAALTAWRQGRAAEAKAKFLEVLAHAPLDGVAQAYADGAAWLAVGVGA